VNKKRYSTLLIWSAALISVVRYMGAFIASDVGSITGWASEALIVLMGITGIGMGLLDSIGTAFLFNGWRMTMPKTGYKWPFKFKILTFFVFGLIIDGLIILVPFTVSRVTGVGMGTVLGKEIWWWATAVNISPFMLLGGVVSGNANMISDDSSVSSSETYRKVPESYQKETGKLAPHWRKVRPTLSYENVVQLANMSIPDIQKVFSKYDVTDRTACNWRDYARTEIEGSNNK
jgi:hypothetical protein